MEYEIAFTKLLDIIIVPLSFRCNLGPSKLESGCYVSLILVWKLSQRLMLLTFWIICLILDLGN